ncbi:hypothetical protein [Novosphingobium sp. FSW06-99]|nr:hypothetical protein [Novosphingobium sp. FSW06-99]
MTLIAHTKSNFADQLVQIGNSVVKHGLHACRRCWRNCPAG